jgi:hypothetical protein
MPRASWYSALSLSATNHPLPIAMSNLLPFPLYALLRLLLSWVRVIAASSTITASSTTLHPVKAILIIVVVGVVSDGKFSIGITGVSIVASIHVGKHIVIANKFISLISLLRILITESTHCRCRWHSCYCCWYRCWYCCCCCWRCCRFPLFRL